MTKKFFIVLVSALSLMPVSILAHPSWGIVVDKGRNIYFADIMHNGMGSVWKLTNKGELELLLQNFHAHNVSLDKQNNLITAHGEVPHTLLRINQNGSLDTLYHTSDYKDFFGGNCAWSTKNEQIIYGLREHKYLREMDINGTQKNIGDYQFIWNQSIYVSPDGTIYASEIGVDNGCIVKIDTNGVSTFIARNLISELDREKDKHKDILLGITEGCDGYIYVAETAGKRIVKILENSQTETFYKSENKWTPTAIDFFSGDAYILEWKETGKAVGPRIVKIDESGNKSIIFNYDTYEKGEITPSTNPNNNSPFWKFALIGIAVMTVLLVVKKNKILPPIIKNSSGHQTQR